MKIKQTKREFDFNRIPKVHDMVNRVANIIVKDIKEGITRLSEDIHGKPFKKISDATKKRKGHDAPLIDSGKMRKVYVKTKASKGSLKAEISMNVRDTKKGNWNYGVIHNEGIKPQEKREWFGVGKRVTDPLNKAVRNWFKLLYKAK